MFESIIQTSLDYSASVLDILNGFKSKSIKEMWESQVYRDTAYLVGTREKPPVIVPSPLAPEAYLIGHGGPAKCRVLKALLYSVYYLNEKVSRKVNDLSRRKFVSAVVIYPGNPRLTDMMRVALVYSENALKEGHRPSSPEAYLKLKPARYTDILAGTVVDAGELAAVVAWDSLPNLTRRFSETDTFRFLDLHTRIYRHLLKEDRRYEILGQECYV